MPGVHAVLFDFHETLITADCWYAMETDGFAMEILQALGAASILSPSASTVR